MERKEKCEICLGESKRIIFSSDNIFGKFKNNLENLFFTGYQIW